MNSQEMRACIAISFAQLHLLQEYNNLLDLCEFHQFI